MKPTPGSDRPAAPWGSFPLAELAILGGTTLLAGFVFVAVVALLFYAAGQLLAVALAIGAVAFVVTFIGLRRVFQRASGGLAFRAGRR